MTGRIFTADHHVYDLPPLLSWNVRHTGTVPCDSWSVTAVYQPEMLTVLRMAAGFAAIENGMTQLRGIVDEYTVELGSRGMTVTLSGRGYAARLLDNESRPVTYEQVTLRELIRCHAEPYGISCEAAVDLRSTVPYTAGVGISQWKVISEFCRTYGGFLPRFAKTGGPQPTPEQKDVLAEMLQDEHIAGIHDTLAYINEMMDLEGLELHQDGESYPNDYFESLHYDFISRCDGDEWPE